MDQTTVVRPRSVGISCKPAAMAARFPIVSASNHEHRDSGQGGTLGDLLYADPAKPRVSETEWRELVAAVAAGDQLALRALFDRTHRLVFTLTLRILGNPASAEEVTLDVFHDIWRRASGYDGTGGSVLGWIMNQARSRAIDRLRFDGRKKRTHSGVADPLGTIKTRIRSALGKLRRALTTGATT